MDSFKPNNANYINDNDFSKKRDYPHTSTQPSCSNVVDNNVIVS